jgi:hypothetical protein
MDEKKESEKKKETVQDQDTIRPVDQIKDTKIPVKQDNDTQKPPSLLPQYDPYNLPKAPPPQSPPPGTPPPQSPPPGTPPPSYPPPYYQQPYYPPPPTYPSIYTWEIYPHIARDILSPKPNKKPVIILIGVLLMLTCAIEIPLAGMFIFYGTSTNVDFGSTYDIEGKIIAGNGTNISGVRVIIEDTGLVSITDSNGNYEMRNVPSGIRTMRLHHVDYKEEKHTILLHEDFAPRVDFQMEEGSGELEFNNLWFLFTIAVLIMMFSMFIIAGSFLAFKARRFAVVLVGGILGMFTTAPTLLFTFIPSIFILGTFGFILSTTAMITTISNRKYFSENVHSEKPEKIPGTDEGQAISPNPGMSEVKE